MPQPESYSSQRAEILRRLDILAEYQSLGLRVAANARPNAGGWLAAHSLYRPDQNPSAAINVGDGPQRGIYIDFGENGFRGKPWLAKGIFDVAADKGSFVTGRDAYYALGVRAGVLEGKEKRKPPPTLEDVERFQKNLTPEVRQYLRDQRGLSAASIARFDLGWDPGRQRNTIPVWDAAPVGKRLVNIRFHNSKKTPKTINWAGHGEARLWGLERLAAAPSGATVIITEGELDALLAEQMTGFVGVSSTNGAKGFKPEWVKHFHGHHVVLLYDSDQAGREAVQSLVLPAFKVAVEGGQVLSLKVIWLYEKPDKEHKDLTDWIVKDGGSGEALKKLMAETPPHTYPTPVSHLPPPVPLQSFEEIDQVKAGTRVTVPLQVYGENTEAYHAVIKVKVTNCPALRDGKCTGRRGHDGACLEEIDIPLGERVMLASVRLGGGAPEGQLQKHLREYVCDKGKQIALSYDERISIREVYAHQVVGAMIAERLQLLEKPIYIIGGGLVEIGKYQATGRVLSTYHQQPTLLVDTLERVEEDYQGFSIAKVRANLEHLRALSPRQIVEDIAQNLTRICERIDHHLGNLLALISPLEFDFPGEGMIRGRISVINMGDTGTGKTTIVAGICGAAQVGLQISGMTASRTGITYGCEHDDKRGWRIKAGVFLKQNRQVLIVDEAQDIKSEDLKTMSEGIDTGYTRIDRIQHKVFESKTRVIFNCNPRHPKRPSEQLTMDSFRYGCEAVKGLFVPMMLRRIDLVLYSASWDVDKEKIHFPVAPEDAPLVSPADLRALIFYGWNLAPEQISVDKNTAHYIRQTAKYLSDKFGGADDLPIVYPEDFRKTLARLSVAYAILDMSVNEDFSQVTVTPAHVAEVCEFLERLYEAENCNLHKYARAYAAAHGLGDLEEIIKRIDAKLAGDLDSKRRFHHIMHQFLHFQEGDRLRKGELTDEFGVDNKTIQRDMMFFDTFRLIKPGRQSGYIPEPKFFRLVNRLDRIDPQKYNFDRPYREVYGEGA